MEFLKSTVQMEEWIWTNGGRKRGGILRCRIFERRPDFLLIVTMNKILRIRLLLEMIRSHFLMERSSKAPEDWGA
ncbi:hypothetical protein BpHYR1_007114 [Brachionus plicatilis]|uniref:Uncharacterized protein n=1 Tax=Brachionus plicatilis TaxID=10195 RepID=A0A3M7REC5_BRAPC|nr:hypothetical protein BpHYR1_007114 [Brachionus plicatilis]